MKFVAVVDPRALLEKEKAKHTVQPPNPEGQPNSGFHSGLQRNCAIDKVHSLKHCGDGNTHVRTTTSDVFTERHCHTSPAETDMFLNKCCLAPFPGTFHDWCHPFAFDCMTR